MKRFAQFAKARAERMGCQETSKALETVAGEEPSAVAFFDRHAAIPLDNAYALGIACRWGSLETIRRLLEHGASFRVYAGDDSAEPLHELMLLSSTPNRLVEQAPNTLLV